MLKYAVRVGGILACRWLECEGGPMNHGQAQTLATALSPPKAPYSLREVVSSGQGPGIRPAPCVRPPDLRHAHHNSGEWGRHLQLHHLVRW